MTIHIKSDKIIYLNLLGITICFECFCYLIFKELILSFIIIIYTLNKSVQFTKNFFKNY